MKNNDEHHHYNNLTATTTNNNIRNGTICTKPTTSISYTSLQSSNLTVMSSLLNQRMLQLWLNLLSLMQCIHALSQPTTSSSKYKFQSINDSSNTNNLISRKQWISSFITTGASSYIASSTLSPSTVNAAETVGKDPECNDSSCLGVW